MDDFPDGEPQVGDVLAGKYVVERVIGRGGMAVVVAARHADLGVSRAIKIPHPEQRHLPPVRERLMREARIAAQLRSEHVVRIHDTGRLADGTPYLVMEHLEGSDLGQVIKDHGPLPIKEAVLCMLMACDALGEAHAMGVVHRDLKPANLFLTTQPNGLPCIKILDFGIARLSEAGSSDPTLTRAGERLGSPAYMAPEQSRSAEVDERADVWALGMILYELVTGQQALLAEDADRPGAFVILDEPVAPTALRPDLPPGLESVILWCLERDPARRLQSADRLKTGLIPFGPKVRLIDVTRAAAAPDYATTVSLTPTVLRRTTAPPPCEPGRGAAPAVPRAAPLPSAPPARRPRRRASRGGGG